MKSDERENSPASAVRLERKRARSSPWPNKVRVLATADSSDPDDSVCSSLSSKSFYGSSKKKYITPLERRDIINIRGEESDLNSSTNVASPKQTRSNVLQGTPKASPKPLAVTKTTPKANNSKSVEKKRCVTPKSSINKSLSTVTDPVNPAEKDTITEVAAVKPRSAKKFFRNSSPGKRARRCEMSVTINKGMNIKYRPSGVAKTPRSPRKKLLTPNGKINTQKTSTPVKVVATPKKSAAQSKPETPTRSSQRLKTPSKTSSAIQTVSTPSKACAAGSNKTCTPRRTPRRSLCAATAFVATSDTESRDPSQDLVIQEEDIDSGIGKPTQDFELRMFESPAKSTPLKSSSQYSFSTSPDSVMLISEIGSSPYSSKSSKKLFPIFGNGSPTSVRSSPRRGRGVSNSSSPLTTPSSSKRSSPYPRSNLLRKATHAKEQMMLDFGQKRIGAIQCQTCGMTYSVAEADDEATHTKFHHRLLNVLKFPGWKKERVVQELPDGSRVAMVLAEDKYAAKKLEQIKQIVDEDLGFVVEARTLRDVKTFLYITESRVVGFCVAQVIQQAYRVLSEEEAARSQDSGTGRARPWCCSTNPEPARVGISRIWVLASHRRCNVATQLLNSVRYNFIMGTLLAVSDIAFSDPTPAGMGFATHYTGTPTFLVYKNNLVL